ncbi:MAG: thermonuclease family protein, partial [Nitrospirota bacterium]
SFDFNCPMSVSQKLRLRGIDCPEIDTEEGQRAKRFVESRLKDCDFIVVKTCKDRTDKFDRYLADVFYLPGASDPALVAKEGTYLNQKLLNERLALPYLT